MLCNSVDSLDYYVLPTVGLQETEYLGVNVDSGLKLVN